jgi:hypothetical protein
MRVTQHYVTAAPVCYFSYEFKCRYLIQIVVSTDEYAWVSDSIKDA